MPAHRGRATLTGSDGAGAPGTWPPSIRSSRTSAALACIKRPKNVGTTKPNNKPKPTKGVRLYKAKGVRL